MDNHSCLIVAEVILNNLVLKKIFNYLYVNIVKNKNTLWFGIFLKIILFFFVNFSIPGDAPLLDKLFDILLFDDFAFLDKPLKIDLHTLLARWKDAYIMSNGNPFMFGYDWVDVHQF
jgi:hypothetical protein